MEKKKESTFPFFCSPFEQFVAVCVAIFYELLQCELLCKIQEIPPYVL